MAARRPLACVIGDISLVRALGIRDIPVAVATPDAGAKSTRSRYCRTAIETPDWTESPDQAIEVIIRWAKGLPQRPVLFYQADADLLAVSRARDRLAPYFHLVLPDQDLVEDLTDKSRFSELATRKGLHVPETASFRAGADGTPAIATWSRFPCVLKPITRFDSWYQLIGGSQKALRIETRQDLDQALERLAPQGSRFLLQAAVEGGEENILSYHAYVRDSGEIVAEFTGRKIRTRPMRYGLSTYLEVTDDAAIRRLGRETVQRLDFSGVLKIDFKRDARNGQLYTLEINPRFNLWHHPGTVAGVAIPEAVYWDCVDPRRVPASRTARPGTRWMVPLSDGRAMSEYRAAGRLTLWRWLYQVLTVDVNEGFQLSDPLPFVADLAQLFRRRVLPDRMKAT